MARVKYFPVILLLLFPFAGFAGDLDGYIVTKDNDTIPVKLSKAHLRLFQVSGKEIRVTGSDNAEKIYTVNDIPAFGYEEKGQRFHFRAKPVERGGRYFLEIVRDGPNASIYQYTKPVAVYGGGGTMQDCYTIEKSNGQLLFLSNRSALPDFDRQFRLFFKEYTGIDALIAPLFIRRGRLQEDIKAVMDYVNAG